MSDGGSNPVPRQRYFTQIIVRNKNVLQDGDRGAIKNDNSFFGRKKLELFGTFVSLCVLSLTGK